MDGMLKQRYTFAIILLYGIILYHVMGMAMAAIEAPLNPAVLNNTIQQNQERILREREQNNAIQESAPAEIQGVETHRTSNTTANETTPAEARFFYAYRIEGNTLIDEAEIRAVTNPYINKYLTFEKIQELAEALTQLYIKKGYANSRVYVAPSSFDTPGLLLFKAQEATIGEVHLEADRWFKPRAILPRLSQKPGDVLNIIALSKGLDRINENPDIDITARLKPGTLAGQSDVELDINSKRTWHLTPHVDSFGRSSIGQMRGGYIATSNNLTGIGDTLAHTYLASTHSQSIVLDYDAPIGSHGFSLGGTFAHSHLEPQGSIAALNLKANAQNYAVTATQELYRNQQWRVQASSALNIKDVRTSIPNTLLQEDNIRTLETRLEARHMGLGLYQYLDQRFTFSTDWLGATNAKDPLASRFGVGNQFSYYSGNLFHSQALPWQKLQLNSRLGYQFAFDALPFSEQIQGGGNYTVRGYSEGYATGDSGAVASVELSRPLPFLPDKTFQFKYATLNPQRDLHYFVFSDYGYLRTRRLGVSPSSSTQLLGLGVGLNATLGRWLSSQVSLGFPVLNEATSGREPNSFRAHFTLNLFAF
jgi:hemolysin activation/secretion protein